MKEYDYILNEADIEDIYERLAILKTRNYIQDLKTQQKDHYVEKSKSNKTITKEEKIENMKNFYK